MNNHNKQRPGEDLFGHILKRALMYQESQMRSKGVAGTMMNRR